MRALVKARKQLTFADQCRQENQVIDRFHWGNVAYQLYRIYNEWWFHDVCWGLVNRLCAHFAPEFDEFCRDDLVIQVWSPIRVGTAKETEYLQSLQTTRTKHVSMPRIKDSTDVNT